MTTPETPASSSGESPGTAWDLSFLGPGHPAANASDAPRVMPMAPGGAAAAAGGMAAGGAGAVTHGLNVTVCRDISMTFVRNEMDLDELTRVAERTVRRIREEWTGPDAEKFYAKWSVNRSQVQEMAESMQRMRRLLDIAIDEQVEASRA